MYILIHKGKMGKGKTPEEARHDFRKVSPARPGDGVLWWVHDRSMPHMSETGRLTILTTDEVGNELKQPYRV